MIIFQENDHTRVDVDSLSTASAAVDRVWSFAACYPSINVKILILILDDIRNLISEIAALMGIPMQRKLNAIRSDPKAPKEILYSTEEAAKKIFDVGINCNIDAYKTRALKKVISSPHVGSGRSG